MGGVRWVERSMMGDGAAKGEFDVGNGGAGWKVEYVFEPHARLESDIVDFSGGLIMEMPVLMKIRAIAAGLAIKMHLANDAVLRQGLQTVVDGGQRNLRQTIFHIEKNILSRRMDAIFHQRFVDLTTLARHAQTVDFMRNFLIVRGVFGVANHAGRRKLASLFQITRIILIFIFINSTYEKEYSCL